MGQQRRQFSPEFKADAVALVRSSGRSISAIARELGIGESKLGYWLKKDEADRKTRDPERFATESAESAENRALRRRVAELEVEREILKRAMAFSSEESHSISGTGQGRAYPPGAHHKVRERVKESRV